MEENYKIVAVVLSSMGAVFVLLGSVLLGWWIRKKKTHGGREGVEEGSILRKDLPPSQFTPQKTRHQRVTFPSFGGKKFTQVEGPQHGLRAEHVQPSTDCHTALKDQLGISHSSSASDVTDRSASPAKAHPALQNRALSADRNNGRGGSAASPSASQSSNTSSNASASLWQNIASKFRDDVPLVDPETSTSPLEGVDHSLGKIHLNIMYDFQTLTLSLRIIRAVGLPAKDVSGTSDPYAKILLLPDKKHKVVTKVKKRNLNPHWNECFLFEGWPHNKLLDKTLHLQVVDYDRFSRDDPIGETYIPLNQLDLSQVIDCWKYLQPCKDSRGKLGEILLSLCYEPNIGRLSVNIMKAKQLKAKDITGASDPYVKMWLQFGTTRTEKKKTSVKMNTLNPVFNQSFVFQVPWEKVREACVEVSVMDFDKVGRNELIGKVLLGCRSGPMETRHWNDMVAKPRQQVAQWHLLKD